MRMAIRYTNLALFLGDSYLIGITMPIEHIDKNTVIVSVSEIRKCGRLDAKHYISGEHERICMSKL